MEILLFYDDSKIDRLVPIELVSNSELDDKN